MSGHAKPYSSHLSDHMKIHWQATMTDPAEHAA